MNLNKKNSNTCFFPGLKPELLNEMCGESDIY